MAKLTNPIRWSDHFADDTVLPEGTRRMNAMDLLKVSFPIKRETVPGIIPTGCLILAGAPKVGKSWFVLQLAIAVATGRDFLGVPAEKGGVLYLALEDGFSRLQKRILAQEGNEVPDLELFELQTEIEKADRGGLKEIEQYLIDNPDTRMVVIDVLKMFRAGRNSKTNPYDQDYADIRPLTALANKYKVTIIIVHHTNKGNALAVDPFDKVSGTGGISGAADGTLILSPDETGSIGLYGRGRDFQEFDMFLRLNQDFCIWEPTNAPEAVEKHGGDLQAAILKQLKRAESSMGANALSQLIDYPAKSISHAFGKLAAKGKIKKERYGNYVLPEFYRE
ncbi:hypothetical protein A6U85_03775 [Agrobacterium sp. 13-626]|nr:hypothetical protein A6U85_03775 [Agrobacterium sp. 13-626]